MAGAPTTGEGATGTGVIEGGPGRFRVAGHTIRLWMVLVGAVTFVAGLLFGYDQGVISGALSFLDRKSVV